MSIEASSDVHGPVAGSPPSSPRLVARDLPYELLHLVFRLASTPSSSSRPRHGGAVCSWHSYEPAAPLSLVCRRWRSPAQAVLFSSVVLDGHERAQAFIDAVKQSERVRQLAKNETAFIVLALDAQDEQSPSSSPILLDPPAAPGRQRATSELLVAALEACSSAAHVHVRTLHQDVRERLLSTLMDPQRPLVTLVLGPTHAAARRWSVGLWDVRDGWDLRPTVQNLEHTGLLAPGPAPSTASIVPPLRPFPQLALRRLKLWHDWPIDLLAAALKSCSSLEYLDLYFEQYKPAQAFFDALKASGKSLREVRYVYNPTSPGPASGDSSSSLSPPPSHSSPHKQTSSPDLSSSSTGTRPPRPAPLFDLLLPHLVALRTLHCTSTELTPSALLALPPSLQSLSVQSLNSLSRFSPRALLAVLRDQHLALPDGFRRLTVTDSPDVWGEEAIDEARLRCEDVGVRFEFRMDFEEEGEYESE
ncbi:hypothetical protein JCM3775_001340 [Rhodotorula graminis]